MSNEVLHKMLVSILLCLGLAYIAYLFALNRTNLATRLRRKGYYRCPHFQHRNILSGSDWPRQSAAASASGTRKELYRSWFAKYGKTFETNIWGRRIFHTCDPVNAQMLMTASTAEIGRGRSTANLVSWLGPGVFTVDGDLWRHSRDMLKPVFKKTAISDMSRLDKHLTRLLNEAERQGFEVDLQAQFLRMFLDFQMDLLIGEDVDTVSNDSSKVDAHSFNKICDAAQLQTVRSAQPWLVRWWNGWTMTGKSPVEATQDFIDRYVDSAVQDYESSKKGPIARSPAFLDELIREVGSKDKIYLRNQILNVFMPGRDSVAIEISYIMYFLARSPAAYQKLRAEVLASGFKRGKTPYEAIKNLAYTNAVVNEALRLGGPPNSQAVRDVLSDIVLPRGGGPQGDQPTLIPTGSIVYVQIQAIQRDETIWGPNAHEFQPERWLMSSKAPQRLAFEWMPFGGGRRICPAMALVMGELAYIVATFAVQYSEIRNLDPDRKLLEEGAIVMKIRGGVHVRLIP